MSEKQLVQTSNIDTLLTFGLLKINLLFEWKITSSPVSLENIMKFSSVAV
jgi:hypothetical protein